MQSYHSDDASLTGVCCRVQPGCPLCCLQRMTSIAARHEGQIELLEQIVDFLRRAFERRSRSEPE